MKYNLEIGQIVYFKCKVIKLNDNCNVYVEGVNVGEKNIKFTTHPNSLLNPIYFDLKGIRKSFWKLFLSIFKKGEWRLYPIKEWMNDENTKAKSLKKYYCSVCNGELRLGISRRDKPSGYCENCGK